MTALYVIAQEYRSALDGLEESSLPAEVIADTLEGIEGELTDKLRAVIAYAATMDAEAAMYNARIKELSAHAERCEKRAESLREYALNAMVTCDIAEVASSDFIAKRKLNPPSVIVEDDSAIPEDFMVQPPIPAKRPDKKAILAVLKEGREVPGCHIERKYKLEIK